jgi:hypothetical protein
MAELLAGVIGALAAGALAKASEIGGRTVTDAYDALKSLIIQKLGKGGAVQSVEDEPRSETAQTALAVTLTSGGLSTDPDLVRLAEAVRAAMFGATGQDEADIEVGEIFGKVNVLVDNLVASGRIELGNIRAETGDARLTNLIAGGAASKKG